MALDTQGPKPRCAEPLPDSAAPDGAYVDISGMSLYYEVSDVDPLIVLNGVTPTAMLGE